MLIAKVMVIRTYFSNRLQRVKLDSVFSSWLKTIIGVPQGFILTFLFFNIFLNDLLLTKFRSIFGNIADDNTLYCCPETTEDVLQNLQSDPKILLKWFGSNQIITKPGKF